MGYPGWTGLLAELASEIGTPFNPESAGDVLVEASRIKSALPSCDSDADSTLFFQDHFTPRTPSFRQLHSGLFVSLGFRGVVTPNYDPVIENAFMADNVAGGRLPSVRSNRLVLREVTTFLTSCGESRTGHRWPSSAYARLLRNPQPVNSDAERYDRCYGITAVLDEQGNPASIALDSIHRKVIWSLLCHPTLFVGFSFRDPPLQHLLRVAQLDFVGVDT